MSYVCARFHLRFHCLYNISYYMLSIYLSIVVRLQTLLYVDRHRLSCGFRLIGHVFAGFRMAEKRIYLLLLLLLCDTNLPLLSHNQPKPSGRPIRRANERSNYTSFSTSVYITLYLILSCILLLMTTISFLFR